MEVQKTETLIALVNDKDQITGYEEKLKVHREGLLHRAFSVVVINSKDEWLLHRRALEKYHSGGSWTNTCCSHLHQGESMEEATRERLFHEMGIEAQPSFLRSFHYLAPFENGLIENEIDHIYLAHWDGTPRPDPSEVMDWQWVHPHKIAKNLTDNPLNYSAWFPKIVELLGESLSNPA